MKYYVGLDVSLKETHFCVVDESGEIISRGRETTHPELLGLAVGRACPEPPVLVVLETGGQSSWLQRELEALGVPAVIVDARRAHAFLSLYLNKNDANDAQGLAQMARSRMYHEVQAKSAASQGPRAVLLARCQLVKHRRDLENLVRGLLRGFGLRVGTVSIAEFEERIWELSEAAPTLLPALEGLLSIRRSLLEQIQVLEGAIKTVTQSDPVCRRLMTVPGVGPLTALSFMVAIDNPKRFKHSSSVGAYLGLTPRGHQSGETQWRGRISKHGDGLARRMLYEAANVLLGRVQRWSALKAWAAGLVRRIGGKKARVALARKLAVILHAMWVRGEDFRWSAKAEAV